MSFANVVTPSWLKPWQAALLTIAVIALAGVVYTKALFIWPLIGLLAVTGQYRWGYWNDGDPLFGQLFNAVIQIALPPLAVYDLVEDLHYLNELEANLHQS
ncbi:MAG: hypothetical protein JWO96_323 [Candidatus Saccharibacteria bacterium]|nr:hypothetical protein [Candidatus Saccharibacteria bacterium]